MAFFSSLPNEKQVSVLSKLNMLIESEHQVSYMSNVSRAKSNKAKRACAGRYEGSWYRLREQWIINQVSNLYVMDCMLARFVIADTIGVNFQSTG